MHVGHDHQLLQRGHLRRDLGHLGHRIDGLAVVEIAVPGEQNLRLGLAETVEHALHAEIGRGRGEDRADAGSRQHRYQGLGQVGHVGRDAIAGHHTQAPQGRGQARHFQVELAMRHAPLALVFAPEHQCIPIVAAAQQVLGKIQLGFGKPFGAGHLLAVYGNDAAHFAAHLAEFPDRGPELFRVCDRPGVQARVVRAGQSTIPAPASGLHELRETGAGNALCGRLPDRRIG